MDEERAARLRELSRRIAGTYQSYGGINRIGERELPSQTRVEELLRTLLAVAFPGFFGGRVSARTDMEAFVASRIDSVFVEMSEIVSRTLRFCQREKVFSSLPLPVAAEAAVDEVQVVAERIVLEYLEQLPSVREILKTDVQAAFDGDPAAISPDEVIICYPGTLAIAVHRLAHPLYLLGVPFVPRIMAEWAHSRTGTDIHPGAKIGSYFFIDHATGVVIGETTEIGERVKIYQGVTLGALSFPLGDDGLPVKGGKRHPTIEDAVTIYAGATILGGATVIGGGAVIGGGCWITGSVAAGVKVTA